MVDSIKVLHGKLSRTWIEDVQSRIPQEQLLKVQTVVFDLFYILGSVIHSTISKILKMFKGAKKVIVRWVGSSGVTPDERRARMTQELMWKLELVDINESMPLEHHRKLVMMYRWGTNTKYPCW